ncbi:MAG: 3-hydroxyacyl-CoA dehydrogenase/enoyl-CoA hydratase family protein [Proteobacteria bacterium]|nr:3-hydroxyacyl-CoA dehydrogenase/enoyl-CoA hydratase family protein [Pseudomonadota bacterium]
MAKSIQKVAVIGSGVMGAAIAAHVANAGFPVLLLDIVPKDASDRNALAKRALEKLAKANPAPFTSPKKMALVTPGNLEDDIAKIKEVDWVIEAVIEKLEIKKDVYRKINIHRKEGAIVSSNTSTIPLANLVEGMPADFQRNFVITHFFNPPRYMRLLELVTSAQTNSDTQKCIRHFCDVHLGKGVVDCKDTPGFIANRIGCFWLEIGLLEAMRLNVTVEEADAVMGKPMGIPKTGVFGLMDMIGIDLLPLIAKEMSDHLPKDDRFREIYKEPPLITRMIKEGMTGRKGSGGFYRLKEDGGKKSKEVMDLATGEYRPEKKVKAEEKKELRATLTAANPVGSFAWGVMSETLSYAASLVPEIADDIKSVDEAMKLGYNWKYGPFELIDRMGTKESSGPKWFAEKLKLEGRKVPPILEKVGDGTFYKEAEYKQYFDLSGSYKDIKPVDGAWMLADYKRGKKPIKKNGSAALWDMGDGVACFEFTAKMNSLDPDVLTLLTESVEIVKKDYKALVIGNDGDDFSVGANIGVLLYVANLAAWKVIDGIIKQGQDAVMALKYAPFPVVGAPAGRVFGGGCEILLHCDAIAAHVETYCGLVEVGVGLVPGWGGCKEMLFRQIRARYNEERAIAKMGRMFSFISPVKTMNTMPPILKAFEYISTAKVSRSAEEMKSMLILPAKHKIVMNRKRVLSEAKAMALELAKGYKAPEPQTINLPGKTARAAMYMGVESFVKSGKATKHDEVVSKAVAQVLSGGDTSIHKPMTEQQVLDLEREVFVKMVKNPDSLARIEHMLETGKPLRN